MVIDVYVPSLKLAFEYQGIHHFHGHSLFGDTESHKRRDNDKRQECNSLGITLIEVPYWWQRDKDSILKVLHEVRPDIV